MSALWTPGQQKAAAINFDLLVSPDTSIVIRINGLSLPAMPAEQVSSLAANLEQAAQRAIASRAPVGSEDGAILKANGPREIVG